MNEKIEITDLVKAYGNTYRVDGFVDEKLVVTKRENCQWTTRTTINKNSVTEVHDYKGRNK